MGVIYQQPSYSRPTYLSAEVREGKEIMKGLTDVILALTKGNREQKIEQLYNTVLDETLADLEKPESQIVTESANFSPIGKNSGIGVMPQDQISTLDEAITEADLGTPGEKALGALDQLSSIGLLGKGYGRGRGGNRESLADWEYKQRLGQEIRDPYRQQQFEERKEAADEQREFNREMKELQLKEQSARGEDAQRFREQMLGLTQAFAAKQQANKQNFTFNLEDKRQAYGTEKEKRKEAGAESRFARTLKQKYDKMAQDAAKDAAKTKGDKAATGLYTRLNALAREKRLEVSDPDLDDEERELLDERFMAESNAIYQQLEMLGAIGDSPQLEMKPGKQSLWQRWTGREPKNQLTTKTRGEKPKTIIKPGKSKESESVAELSQPGQWREKKK